MKNFQKRKRNRKKKKTISRSTRLDGGQRLWLVLAPCDYWNWAPPASSFSSEVADLFWEIMPLAVPCGGLIMFKLLYASGVPSGRPSSKKKECQLFLDFQ